MVDRIAIVEDERLVRELVAVNLRHAGYEIVTAENFAEGKQLLSGGEYQLAILDVMLPGGDGFALTRHARDIGISVPILMLTARSDTSSKVRGLDAGADDYLVKPFAFEELLARVRALLRRGSGGAAPVLRLGDLSLDPATRIVTRGRRRISLTAREYALLEYLLRNTGRVLTRPMITQHVWGMDFDPESNIVDVYVGYLRRKIDADGETRLVQTVRGAGYSLRVER